MSGNPNLSIESNKPLAYLFNESILQDHLPYIDSDPADIKSKIAYMIKMEQKENMQTINPYNYIQDIKILQTPFINSQKFHKQVERVKNKISSAQPKEKEKQKAKNVQIDQQKLNKGKLNVQTLKSSLKDINHSYVSYEQSQLKNLDIETHKQFSPFLLKQMIQSLQQQKAILKKKIEHEKEEISEINRLRKYQQLQARERQDVVEQRIKLMVNKRRKMQ